MAETKTEGGNSMTMTAAVGVQQDNPFDSLTISGSAKLEVLGFRVAGNIAAQHFQTHPDSVTQGVADERHPGFLTVAYVVSSEPAAKVREYPGGKSVEGDIREEPGRDTVSLASRPVVRYFKADSEGRVARARNDGSPTALASVG